MEQDNPSAAVACTQWEEDLVLYYYGELDGERAHSGGRPCARLRALPVLPERAGVNSPVDRQARRAAAGLLGQLQSGDAAQANGS